MLFVNDVVWHVGESTEQIKAELFKASNSDIWVLADGDELTYILRNFHNLLHHNTRAVQAWRGDLAKFIVENL